jgi:hypothetical protein
MRTTINLDEQLLRDLKGLAVESGRTLTSIIEDALRETLARRKALATRARVELPVSKAKGWVLPGVDIEDTAGLLDIMEGDKWSFRT